MIQTINLDLVPSSSPTVFVRCSQYDKGSRQIQINVYNRNALFNIPANSVVTVRGTKPQDMTGFEYECTYNGSIVTFPIQPQMTVYAGKIPAELRITKDGTILGSANFFFNVEESPLSDNTVISDTDLPLLQEAIDSVDTVLSYRNEAEQSAEDSEAWAVGERGGEAVEDTDPTYHNNSKYYSEQAYASEQSASQSSADALSYKNDAKDYRDDALSYKNLAEGYKNDAYDYKELAKGYKDNAYTSEVNAKASEDNAKSSEDNALSYKNDAKSYRDDALSYKNDASGYSSDALGYKNEAKGYRDDASASATSSQTNALKSEGFAVGKQNGTDVTSGSPYYENNAKYYSEQAESSYNDTVALSNNFALKDGVYPKLIAGGIIESEIKDEEFTYQQTEHTGIANLNSIKGNTLAWNQLNAPSSNRSRTINGLTFTNNNDGSVTVSGECSTSSGYTLTRTVFTFPSGNKVFIYGFSKTSSGVEITSGSSATTEPTGSYGVIVQSSGSSITINLYVPSGVDFGSGVKVYPQITDLTKAFGSTIADEVYAMETAQRGSGVEYVRKLYSLSYYKNNTGSLLSFTGTGIKVTGKNLFNVDDVASYLIPSDSRYGVKFTTEGTYTISAQASGGYMYVRSFYSDGTSKDTKYVVASSTVVPQTLSISQGEWLIVYDALSATLSDALTRFGKWKPQVEFGSSATTYEEYHESTLSLPISTYFPTGMKSAGSGANRVYDELTEEKAITRVGTRAYTSGDESDTTVTTDGTYTNYALTTPTETDVDLDLTYRTYEGGTEQLLPINTDEPTTSPIKVNVEFDFDENLNARIEKMLNCLAQVETSPTTHAYSSGDYLMYNYQLYRVTSNIANGGTLTVGTNITATTVMDELKSLTA